METFLNFAKESYIFSVLCGGSALAITMFAGWALTKSLNTLTSSSDEE